MNEVRIIFACKHQFVLNFISLFNLQSLFHKVFLQFFTITSNLYYPE